MRHVLRPLWGTALGLAALGWPCALLSFSPCGLLLSLLAGASVTLVVLVTASAFSGHRRHALPCWRPVVAYVQALTTSTWGGLAFTGLSALGDLFGWRAAGAAATSALLVMGVRLLFDADDAPPAVRLRSSRRFEVPDVISPLDLALAWDSSTTALMAASSVTERLRLVEVRALYLDLLLREAGTGSTDSAS
jgi:hypothetical protein